MQNYLADVTKPPSAGLNNQLMKPDYQYKILGCQVIYIMYLILTYFNFVWYRKNIDKIIRKVEEKKAIMEKLSHFEFGDNLPGSML